MVGPTDDAAAVTAGQLRAVVGRLIAAGQWQPGDRDILVVMDAGYDVMRLAWVLRDLPVELVGRLRDHRRAHPAPPRAADGRRPPQALGEDHPPRHPAHSDPSPAVVLEHPPPPGRAGPRTETRPPRPRTPTRPRNRQPATRHHVGKTLKRPARTTERNERSQGTS
nr:transposase [Streptomyces clavuligerus]